MGIRVVAAVVIEGGALLLVRKRLTSRFMLPGGKPSQDEDDLSCLARELREEVAVDIDPPATFLGCFTADAANEPNLLVHARIYRVAVRSRPVPSGEIDELFWLPLDKGADDISLAPLVSDAVLPLLARVGGVAPRGSSPDL